MRTYGTVTLKGETWVVECEPHVLLRLKRMFARAGRAHGAVKLSATPEVSLELRWFLQRYPMEVTPSGELDARADAHQESMALVDALLSRQVEPLAFDLAIPLREYQRLAASVTLATGSLLLADDVGIGKTASAIGIFSDPRTLPALVVTLTHLPKQWENEIHRFAPRLRTHILKKGTPYDLTQLGRARGKQLSLAGTFPDVIITNYHKLAGWVDTLAPARKAPLVRSIVFDECQELRTGKKSNKGAAAHHVAKKAAFRLGLSATPIYNYGGEFHAVMECLRPGALGTWEEFNEEWCIGSSDKPRIKDPKAFGSYMRETGLMLRRTRSDVGRELPALTKVPHHVDADPAVFDKVADAASELARIILRQGQETRGEKMLASDELNVKLRQATGLAKAPFVAEFVRMLADSGERVVLYGWHRDVYSVWLQRLRAFAPAMYTGTESTSQKDVARKRFLEGETPILIMSLRSGAGLDGLQNACRTVVFGELDWSPGVHEQCTGRVYRDGQVDPVVAYYLLADTGSDPIVADVLGLKKQQIEGLRDPDGALVEKLDVGEGNVRRLAEAFLAQRGIQIENARPPK